MKLYNTTHERECETVWYVAGGPYSTLINTINWYCPTLSFGTIESRVSES
jgi:hypothetical protein